MGIGNKLAYFHVMLRRYGLVGGIIKVIEKKTEPINKKFCINTSEYFPNEEELDKQRKKVFKYAPLISIIVPTYETETTFLEQLLDSIEQQTYSNWQLCIADGSYTDKVQKVLKYRNKNKKIKYLKLEENDGISGNTNKGFDMASGEYIALLDHDDVLSANALFEMVKKINECIKNEGDKPELLYSDEDKINYEGKQHFEPHFKKDYDPELLLHYNYFCHFLMFSKCLQIRTGYLDKHYDGAQDYDYVLRMTENTDKICHVAKILYHWRVHSGSTAGSALSKNYAYMNSLLVVQNHMNRMKMRANVIESRCQRFGIIQREIQNKCIVSIVTDKKTWKKNRKKFVNSCKVETQFIDNSEIKQMERVLMESDYLCVIKSGVNIVTMDWGEKLLAICEQQDIGAVTAKKIAGLDKYFQGYMQRQVLSQRCNSISKDLFVVKKEFIQDYIANDNNLDENIIHSGYYIVWNPEVMYRIIK